MKIHKRSSHPKALTHESPFSVDVLIWDGYDFLVGYYSFEERKWKANGREIQGDFVWIYPPFSKMKEVFNRITEK